MIIKDQNRRKKGKTTPTPFKNDERKEFGNQPVRTKTYASKTLQSRYFLAFLTSPPLYSAI